MGDDAARLFIESLAVAFVRAWRDGEGDFCQRCRRRVPAVDRRARCPLCELTAFFAEATRGSIERWTQTGLVRW